MSARTPAMTPSHAVELTLLPQACRDDLTFWRRHLEPVLAMGRGTTAALQQIAEATGAGYTTVTRKYYALKDQTDPANTTTFAEVGVITSEHVFLMNELDGAVPATSIGQLHSLDVTSNVCTVDTADNTTPCFRVVGIFSQIQPITDKSDDIKGRLLVKILQSVLDT